MNKIWLYLAQVVAWEFIMSKNRYAKYIPPPYKTQAKIPYFTLAQLFTPHSTTTTLHTSIHYRRTSNQPQFKVANHSANILPKLEQRNNNLVLSTHPARPVEQRDDISLPKINLSATDVTSQRMQSYSNTKANSTKQLTIQIPSASGDNNNTTTGRLVSTVSSRMSKSKANSLPERLSNHTLLAPTCNSLSGSEVQSRKSVEDMAEETPVGLARAAEAIHTHGESDGGVQLAVLPAISNLSGMSPTTTSMSLTSSRITSSTIASSKKLRKGSLVVADKSLKRCISLRVSRYKYYLGAGLLSL